VAEKLADNFTIEFQNVSYEKILTKVRDYIHKGHHLLSHPLSGSVKPLETPYKSIVISAVASELCFHSLSIIEESIASIAKFQASSEERDIPKPALNDFMVIDCSLISQGGYK